MVTIDMNIKMDANVEKELQELMAELGLDIPTFFMMAAKQAIREQRIPFEVSIETPNTDTVEAFKEVEEMKKNPTTIKSYGCFGDLLKEIETECIE